MAYYVLLMRYRSHGIKRVHEDPTLLLALKDAIERWESKVLHNFHLLGEWDQCTIIEAPDNLTAYRASLAHEISTTADIDILPAIDLPLFQRLISQTTETAGPHTWQIRWWAKVARRAMRRYAYTRWVDRYCQPMTVTGQEHFDQIDGPCVIVGNHTSHMDGFVLHYALPERIKRNLYFGAAADRWFLKGQKKITRQPWYQSLINGSYPIQRGGGSKTLDYPKWLLDQGCYLMLFPEGTRARGSGLSKFKHGVSILALDKNVPVVPVYLDGLKKMRPVGAREIVPGPAAAHIQAPIRFEPGTEVPDATRQIYEAMNAVHQRLQRDATTAA
jgi:1-acyl-sn-glycerol-3-phosphate acyltransferase